MNNYGQIYLFDTEDQQSNTLNLFIKYLKYQNFFKDKKWSYCPEEHNLHNEITIHKNLELEAYKRGINQHGNEFFNSLVDNLGVKEINKVLELVNLEDMPTSLDPQTKKLISIIKTTLSQRDILFFNNPEKFLENGQVELIKNLFLNYTQQHQIPIYLSSSTPEKWIDIIDFKVSKEPKGDFYSIKKNKFKHTELLYSPNTLPKAA